MSRQEYDDLSPSCTDEAHMNVSGSPTPPVSSLRCTSFLFPHRKAIHGDDAPLRSKARWHVRDSVIVNARLRHALKDRSVHEWHAQQSHACSHFVHLHH